MKTIYKLFFNSIRKKSVCAPLSSLIVFSLILLAFTARRIDEAFHPGQGRAFANLVNTLSVHEQFQSRYSPAVTEENAGPPRNINTAATRGLSGFESLPSEFMKALAEYRILHASAVSADSLKTIGSEEKGHKIIIAELDNQAGLCNRMTHIASAFLFGMLTGRAILFDWHAVGEVEYHDGIERISQADFSDLFEVNSGFDFSLRQVATGAGVDPDVLRKAGEPLLHYAGDFLGRLRCHNPSAAFSQRVIKVIRFEWWIAAAMANPHHESSIAKWFPGGVRGASIFQYIAAVIFPPSLPVKSYMSLAKVNDRSCSIGMQIRRHWSRKTSGNDLFLSCARRSQDWIQRYDSNQSFIQNGTRKQFRLSTDDISTSTEFQDIISSGDLLKPVFDGACRSSKNCLQMAIADMYILSECEAVVTTDSSTFGRCAAALGGRPYAIVTTDGQCLLSPIADPINAGVVENNLGNMLTPYSDITYTCPVLIPPRGCIVYIVYEPTVKMLADLRLSIESVDLYLNGGPRYPFVILTDDTSRYRHIQTWTLSRVIFERIEFGFRHGFNSTRAPEIWRLDEFPQHPGFNMKYRHMSRFASGPMFELPVFDHFDYIIKFDGDALMTSTFTQDPILELASKSQRQFSFWIQYEDLQSVTHGLSEAIHNFLAEKKIVLKTPGIIFHPNGEYRRTNFYGCFWAARTSFFKSDRYREIFKFFDSLDGFHMHRWDEQKLIALAVAAYLDPSTDVLFMDYAKVSHQTWVTPQKCCGL
jgi:hypothetical protein